MAFWDIFKRGLQRVNATTEMGKSYKDVFDINGVPSYRTFYNMMIFPAKYVYRGLYKPWHIVAAPTVKQETGTRTLFRLGMAKAVCAELASLIWAEGADIHITTNGEDDTLERFVKHVLNDNGFGEKMQEHIEQSVALGGGAIKEYVTAEKEEGQTVTGTEVIHLDYCMADQFVPTAWNNANVFEAVFVSREAIGGYYYTRLEWHSWDGDTYIIKNELFRASADNQDILGFRYPLADVYPDLQPVTEIKGLTKSLFAYYRTPVANNVDDNSPLGISAYGNAFDTLHALDICYDSFVREFRLGKKRIIVPASAVRVVTDPTDGHQRRYFDANDEVYEALATDNVDDLKITDNTVELRIEEHVEALNCLLSILCLQVGFSAGTFTFDEHSGLKTATEVISERSKTYKTVCSYQKQIAPAIKKVCENIIELGVLYDMQFDGKSIPQLARDYEISVTMEDAVIEDSNTRIDKGIKLVQNGFISKLTALTDPKYGIGMTEEEAETELKRIAAEGQISAEAFDVFQSGTLE